MEMTYYDTRPRDDGTMDRRREAIQKSPSKAMSSDGKSTVAPGSKKHNKEVKRRPLPSMDANNELPARAGMADRAPPAKGPNPPSSLPSHDNTTPPAGPQGMYDEAAYDASAGVHETYDDVPRQWEPPFDMPTPLQPADQRSQYFYPEQTAEMAIQSGYNEPPLERLPPVGMIPNHSEPASSIVDMYPQFPQPLIRASTYPPVATTINHHSPFPTDPIHQGIPAEPSYFSGIPEPEQPDSYFYSPNYLIHADRSRSNSVNHEEDHHRWEYATMQPSVEDEEEEVLKETLPPPPPPLHRSVARKAPPQTYQAHPSEIHRPELVRNNSTVTLTSQRPTSQSGLDAPPSYTDAAKFVPSQPIAGYNIATSEVESDHGICESQVDSRRQSGLFEEEVLAPPPLSLPLSGSGSVPVSTPLSAPAPIPAPTTTEPATTQASPDDLQTQAKNTEQSIPPTGSESRVPPRKSVSPKPPASGERDIGAVPFSPDSYNALNPNFTGAPSVVDFATQDGSSFTQQLRSLQEVAPIIGDDGREIDPSDHLPCDTWAPEPEKKPRKPEVIVRFKHPSQTNTSAHQPRERNAPPSTTASASARNMMIPATGNGQRSRPPPTTHIHITNDPMSSRSRRDGYGIYVPTRPLGYNAPRGTTATDPRVSPAASTVGSTYSSSSRAPFVTSSLYEPVNPGPPIPTKVPIAAPIKQGHPVTAVNKSMDALSRELNSIDIGSVGCGNGRTVRRYVPRTLSTGYAV